MRFGPAKSGGFGYDPFPFQMRAQRRSSKMLKSLSDALSRHTVNPQILHECRMGN
jgi:hypothetical protein